MKTTEIMERYTHGSAACTQCPQRTRHSSAAGFNEKPITLRPLCIWVALRSLSDLEQIL